MSAKRLRHSRVGTDFINASSSLSKTDEQVEYCFWVNGNTTVEFRVFPNRPLADAIEIKKGNRYRKPSPDTNEGLIMFLQYKTGTSTFTTPSKENQTLFVFKII